MAERSSGTRSPRSRRRCRPADPRPTQHRAPASSPGLFHVRAIAPRTSAEVASALHADDRDADQDEVDCADQPEALLTRAKAPEELGARRGAGGLNLADDPLDLDERRRDQRVATDPGD